MATTQGGNMNKFVPIEYTREASELMLAPGDWPVALRVEGQDFYRIRFQHDREQELLLVEYLARSGDKLTVFND